MAAGPSRRWLADGFLFRAVHDGRFGIPECGLLIAPAGPQAQSLGEIFEQPQLLCVTAPLPLVSVVLRLRCRTDHHVADEWSDAQRQRLAVIGRRGKGDDPPGMPA